MCGCRNVDIGSYKNQVIIDRPKHMIGRNEGSSNKKICIDKCIVDEIKELWVLGVTTTGCCCGHNKMLGYIGVIDRDIAIMKTLGYKAHKNNLRPNDNDSFVPKSEYCPICQKSITPSMFDGLTIQVDDDRGDLEYLQELADRNDFFPATVTYASGISCQGLLQIVGEIQASSQNATATISLSGGGGLKVIEFL